MDDLLHLYSMRKVSVWLIPLLLAACETNRVIVNNIDEREANEIIVFLASNGIDAQKIAPRGWWRR